MQVVLYLVRHGQTEYIAAIAIALIVLEVHHSNDLHLISGRKDIELNAMGIKQAGCVGRFLKDIHFDEVVCSPLKRCEATARAIVPHLPSMPPFKADARLIDRGMSSWDGTVRRYYIPEPDDAETWEQWVDHASVLSRAHTRVAGRTRAWTQDLLEGLARSTRQAKDGDAAAITRKIMLVSHDATIVALLNQLQDSTSPVKTRLDLGESVAVYDGVENGSVSQVTFTLGADGWAAVIQSWGEDGHVFV